MVEQATPALAGSPTSVLERDADAFCRAISAGLKYTIGRFGIVRAVGLDASSRPQKRAVDERSRKHALVDLQHDEVDEREVVRSERLEPRAQLIAERNLPALAIGRVAWPDDGVCVRDCGGNSAAARDRGKQAVPAMVVE